MPPATVAFRLPDGFTYPEGAAWDPSTGGVYVTSTPTGAVAVAAAGSDTASVWLPAGSDGRGLTLGIEFARGSVWIVSPPALYEYRPDGTLRSRHAAASPPGAGFLNDVAITDDGVYVTDSNKPVLWHLPLDAPDGTELQPIDVGALVATAAGQGFNGIEALPDGTLIVGQFGCCSLLHVDPRAPSAVAVDLGGYQLAASDGMSLHGDDLWIARGVTSDSVDRIRLCPTYDCGTVVAGPPDPALSFPTDVQVVDGAVLVVNSQFDNGGGLGDGIPTLPFTVAVIPMP